MLKKHSKERSRLVDRIAEDMLPKIRELDIVRNGMDDGDAKWWLVLYIIDLCLKKLDGYSLSWPEERENGETWGFIGYEKASLPEVLNVGCNRCGTEETMFNAYKIKDYGMWDRAGEMNYREALLLGDIVRNRRRLSDLSQAETEIWRDIDGRFAHSGQDGTVVPDVLVLEGKAMDVLKEAIEGHSGFAGLLENLQSAFDGIVEILKENSIEVLRTQLPYCVSMDMFAVRMLTIHDEVEDGRLTVPKDTAHSTVAMWMQVE